MVATHDKRSFSTSLPGTVREQEAVEASLFAGIALKPSRKDALPENTHYADTGCDLHPSCLTCPLVRCRYDEPGGARRLLSEERDRRIVWLQRQEQLSIDLLAERFTISRRTVFRVLAKARESE